MKNKLFVLILLICVMCFQIVSYAFEFQKPSWCSSAGRYNGYYKYIVSDDLKEIVKSSIGTSSDSSYISSAFDCFVADENRLYESAENSSLGNNIYKQVDFSAENVLYFDYYSVDENGNNRHSFYYFIPDNKTLNKDDLFYYVSPPKGPASSNTGNVYSKSTKTSVSGTFYRGYVSYDSNVDECSVCVQYDCFGPSNIPYNGTFEIESDIACYMTSSSIDDVYSGSVQPDNLEDFLPKRYGVLEAPRDLKFRNSRVKEFLKGDVNVSFTWKQTDENYKNWNTEILVYADVKYRTNILIFGDWHYTGSVFIFDDVVPTKNLKYSFNQIEAYIDCPAVDEIIQKDLGHTSVQSSIEEMEIMIRNRYVDDQYVYYSNWVKLTISSEGVFYDDDDYSNGSITAEEFDYDDPVIGDSDVDFSTTKPTGTINPDSPYQGDVLGGDLDEKSLIDNIANGFGLSGEGGVLDLFSDFFNFIPAPIWTLILAGVSTLIAIALLKAVL